MMRSGELRIERARLVGGVPEDQARLSNALDRVTPIAIGLSPRSVLIVRRMAARIRLARHGVPDAFISGVVEDLRVRATSARRGRYGRDDEDLLFEDDADFEAAIVANWLDGGDGKRWWTSVIANQTPIAHWRRTVLHDPHLLPRAIGCLVEQGLDERWLMLFDPPELITATTRMLQTHGAASVAIAALETGRCEANRNDLRASIADLAEIAPEAMTVPRRDIATLIATAAVIVRRPAWFGTRGFARALATVGLAEPSSASVRLRASRLAPLLEGDTQVATMPENKSTKESVNTGSLGGTGRSQPHPNPPVPMPDPATHRSYRPHQSQLDTVAPATTPTAHAAPAMVATEFGGLFFLLNVFLALGIYGDFTRPADGIKGLSPFELLLLLARRWFGPQFDADPLAGLLRELAGLHPGERPGRQFEAPVWSVPSSWLLPWSDARPTRSGYAFALADDPDTPRSAACRRRRWVACLARYLEARLARALGGVDRRGAILTTCFQPGRIARDRDRIEIRFPLADHPIALRLAGIDRDPGWIPAAGHFVEFRFA